MAKLKELRTPRLPKGPKPERIVAPKVLSERKP